MTDPIDNQDFSDFQQSKYRLTGAFVWLGLLVVVVPIWYNNPVNFDPTSHGEAETSESKTILVKKPFLLPDREEEKETTGAKVAINTQTSVASSGTEAQAPKEMVRAEDSAVSSQASPQAKTPKAEAIPDGRSQADDASEWIIRLVAYKKKEMAEGLHDRLKYDYEAFIKFFPKSNYYSVRVGPYTSKALAEKDQKRLDRLLRIQSELVKFKRTP